MPLGLSTNITQTGNGQNLYALASGGGGAGGVSSIIAGNNVTIDPPTGVGAVTINADENETDYLKPLGGGGDGNISINDPPLPALTTTAGYIVGTQIPQGTLVSVASQSGFFGYGGSSSGSPPAIVLENNHKYNLKIGAYSIGWISGGTPPSANLSGMSVTVILWTGAGEFVYPTGSGPLNWPVGSYILGQLDSYNVIEGASQGFQNLNQQFTGDLRLEGTGNPLRLYFALNCANNPIYLNTNIFARIYNPTTFYLEDLGLVGPPTPP